MAIGTLLNSEEEYSRRKMTSTLMETGGRQRKRKQSKKERKTSDSFPLRMSAEIFKLIRLMRPFCGELAKGIQPFGTAPVSMTVTEYC